MTSCSGERLGGPRMRYKLDWPNAAEKSIEGTQNDNSLPLHQKIGTSTMVQEA